MKACFQFVQEEGGEPVDLPTVDNEMRTEFGAPQDEHDWYMGWYDKIGYALGSGTKFSRILQVLDLADADQRLVEAVKWLGGRYYVRCWTEL